MNVMQVFLSADVVIKAVLLSLGFLSAATWAIILYKALHLNRAKRESAAFLNAYLGDAHGNALLKIAHGLKASSLANLFVYHGSIAETVKRDRLRGAIERAAARESAALHTGLTFLATTGSTAPFIGLFGTVWGIINAFHSIGEAGSAALAVVAPGIAEALVTTAVGLAAAIPAAVGYNFFLGQAANLADEAAAFCDELVGEPSRRAV